MKIWTVANQKGGVGKTTSVVSLGGLLAHWGFRTLMVDMDPHGSLTQYFRLDPDNLDTSAYTLFQAASRHDYLDPAYVIHPTNFPKLELIPGVMALATLDRMADRLEGLGLVLKNALTPLKDRFDFVLIDCPPLLGVLMVNALAACERVIIPVQTEFLALKGLERMLQTLDMVLKARPERLACTIIPTLHDQRLRAANDSLAILRAKYPDRLSRTLIPVDTKFRDASKAGLTPVAYDPKSRGLLAYGELLEDLLNEQRPAARRENGS